MAAIAAVGDDAGRAAPICTSISGRTAASVCHHRDYRGIAFTWAMNWPPFER